jgi:PAS domain S-box-containing protein
MANNRSALILNVDDNEAGRYAKTRALRRADGIEVIEAETGGDALRLVEERRPALVLLDVKLPDINGLEVCRRIKRDRPETLVLQISASFTSGRDRTRGLDAGADSYLTQPVEPNELVASVRALLRIREAEARLRASEERLRLVVDGAKDHAIITTDGEGRITGWSSGAEAIFGWSAPEAVGQDTALIFTPEDRAAGAHRQEIETARREGCAEDERWHTRKDGGCVFMNGSLRPLHDAEGREAGFLKVASDETARRGTHETAARLAAIVSATPDAIVSFSGEDVPRRFLEQGRGTLVRLHGRRGDRQARRSAPSPPDRLSPREGSTGVFRWAMEEGAVQIESVRRRKDGTLTVWSRSIVGIRLGWRLWSIATASSAWPPPHLDRGDACCRSTRTPEPLPSPAPRSLARRSPPASWPAASASAPRPSASGASAAHRTASTIRPGRTSCPGRPRKRSVR